MQHMEIERLSVITDSKMSACFQIGCKMPFVANCSEVVLMRPDLRIQGHHYCYTCAACGISHGDTIQCHLRDGKSYCTEGYVR